MEKSSRTSYKHVAVNALSASKSTVSAIPTVRSAPLPASANPVKTLEKKKNIEER
jgi:hypothetical protein